MSSISVVITVFNGADRLYTQLITLRDQSRKADEVLIFDDCSTDQSVEIIQNFIYENHLYEWTLIQNEHNKGRDRNFADGINTARGDIIFLADQDDEWHLSRIETMAEILESNEEATVLASGFRIRHTKVVKRIMKRNVGQSGKEYIEKVQLSGKTMEPLLPGCTYAFKKEIISVFNAVWNPDDAHDRVIWDIALLEGGLYLLNKELIKKNDYHHDTLIRNTDIAERMNMLQYRIDLAERLSDVIQNKTGKQWLRDYIAFAEINADAINHSSIQDLISLRKNSSYMPLSGSWMLDIVSVIRVKLKKASHR